MRKFKFLLLLLFLATTIIGCVENLPENGKATTLKLEKSNLTLKEGESLSLLATVTPNEFAKDLIWSSSDKNVATVSNKGLISALNEGTTTIKVETKESNLSANCQLTVTSTKFITVWQIEEANKQIKLPLDATGTYDFTVDWGDNSSDQITSFDQAEISHTYTIAGEYTVKIKGTITGFGFTKETSSNANLIDIKNWGNVKLHNNGYQFYKTSLTTITAQDTPDLSHLTNINHMFAFAKTFNSKLNQWDVSHIEDMDGLFSQASEFNADISQWKVQNVEDMSYLFSNAQAFNADISQWNVSKVKNMNNMFSNTHVFNADISQWKVQNVEDMNYMFYRASSFSNHDLSGWDVSKVIAHSFFLASTGEGNTEPNWP